MNTSHFACQLPRLINGERKKGGESDIFRVRKANIVSMDRIYRHSTLKELLGLEKSLLHAVWIILLNLYTKHSEITFGANDLLEPHSQLTVKDFEVLQSIYDERTENLLVADWIKELAKAGSISSSSATYLSDNNSFNTYVAYSDQETSLDILNLEFVSFIEGWLNGDSLDAQFTFSSSYLELEHGQLLSDQFAHIATILVHNLDRPLKLLNWTSEKEKNLLLTEWQQGKADFVRELDDYCIHHLVERQVEATPDNIALQFEDKEWVTYAELNNRANKLAHHFIHLGVVPDELVPLCIEKSVDMVVAILAVLKAGAAYVPLDAEYPKERISYILKDTAARFCITTSSLAGVFSESPSIQLVMMDQSELKCIETSEINPVVPQLKSSNLCYLIFTSGTTGKPKGVMLEHRNVVNYVAAHQKILNLTQSDRFLQFSNYTFDASVLDLFVNLTIGSRICLASKNNLLTNLPKMANLMKVTAAQLTTTVAGLLNPTEVPTLRLLQQGGEMLTNSVRDSWTSKVTFHNGYGPTETTVYAIIRESLSQHTSCTNIGRPIGRNKVFILNDRLELLPPGAVGELCIGGPQLARGYLNRPELTEEVFVESPFAIGERLYRTGDLGRFNPDGSITILGRKDNQIKLNGLRIEIGEIEHALLHSPQVFQASVRLLKKNFSSSKEKNVLVAFFTLTHMISSDEPVSIIDAEITHIQELVRNRLPQYMVPTVWIPLSQMPINASGKTDFRMLELLHENNSKEIGGELVQMMKGAQEVLLSPMEELLQEVWGDVLNIAKSRIGPGDSFYYLGGDSISAIQISSQCRQVGVEVSVQSILQHPTIHQLANYAQFTTIELEKQKLVEDEESDIPFTPIQCQFFGVEQSDIHHFHLSWLVKVQSPIHLTKLKAALSELTCHHDMLRTRFCHDGNHWRQWLASSNDTNFEVEHQHASGIEELRSSVHRVQTSLNIETGPVSSFVLYDLPSGEQLMFMTIHHYIIDLVSWRIIWEDLEKLLRGQSLSHKTLSFRNWSNLLRHHAESLSIENWPKQVPMVPFKVDESLLHLNTMETVHTSSFTLDSEYTKLIFGLSNDVYRTEAVDFMLSSLASSYCTTFNSSSLSIATEGHGREPWDDSLDISRTVGWFTSIYPITIESNPEDSMIDVLKRTKDIRKGIPARGLNYGLLRYLNEKQSAQFCNDSLQVGFNYFGRFQYLEKTNSLFQDVEDEYKFDLNMIGPKWRRMNAIEVEVTLHNNKLCASISYSSALHRAAQITQWSESWKKNMMETIYTCANKKEREFTISDLPLLALNTHELDEFMHQISLQYGPDLVQNIEDIYPCSPIQEGLILGNIQSPAFYHVQDVYNVTDAGLEIDGLISAWKIVIHDLPILRTVFISNPSTSTTTQAYLQIVLRDIDLVFESITAENCDNDAILKKYLEEDVAKGFPLGKPNIRLCIIYGKKAQMIISRHHAINDGWSDKITMTLLEAVYNNSTRPAVIPYKDYISYRNKHDDLFDSEDGSDYWISYLAAIEPCVFPKLGVVNRTLVKNYQLLSKCRIPTKKLKEFSKTIGITLLTILQAAWGLVLRPYYEKDDIIYGILTNGRNIPMKNIELVIGPCINTTLVRIQYSKGNTIVGWLQSLHQQTIDRIPYETCSLRKIKHWSRSNNDSLEFDAILNFQSSDSKDDVNHPRTFEAESIREPTEYKIGLNAWTETEELYLRLDYANETITHEIANCILDRLNCIIDAIIMADHDTKVTAIPEMSFAEKSLIKSFATRLASSTKGEKFNNDLSDTQLVYDAKCEIPNIDSNQARESFSCPLGYMKRNETCLHHTVEEHAALHPDNIAVQFETSESVTYGELNRRANQLAHHLIELGARPESMVTLCLDKSVSMIVAMLAVLKAGGAYVPLDPNNPVERNLFILDETKAQLVVTLDRYKVPYANQLLVLLDIDDEPIQQKLISNPEVSGLTPSNLCYVLYTSGSTGTPKGVLMEHSAVVSSIYAHKEVWNPTLDDSVLQFANYTFDVSVIEIFGTLAVGACIAIAEKENLLSRLEDCINQMNVTFMMLTTTIAGTIQPEHVPSVKCLMIGGEMLTSSILSAWASTVELSNVYGPTEAAIAILVNHNLYEEVSCSNIGKPIGSNKIHILGLDMHPVPIGVVGELCVSGPQLARGYLNRPDLTEKAFVLNPLDDNERLYRTGDLARFNSDGSVELIGRKDNQIKLNGLRIELDEIEHALYGHSKVTRACVLPLITDQSTNRKSLVAFLAFSDFIDDNQTLEVLSGSSAEIATVHMKELKSLVRKRLPSYMVPNIWVPLGSIPINTSGKIDRKRLSTFFGTLSLEAVISVQNGGVNEQDSSLTSIEQMIQGIWSQILNITASSISIDDSFYQLGGDSISAIRVSSSSRQNGFSLSVKQIMQNPTIRAQASVITPINVKLVESHHISQGEVRLTPILKHFLDTPQSNIHHFNQSWLLKLRDSIATQSLNMAISSLLQHHELLRSRFAYSGDQWQIKILPIEQVQYKIHHTKSQSFLRPSLPNITVRP
ncbi:hypothetical protein K7432_009731 [Basidiobolus ranarum]|uniref:Carrier domain-containing protein n=1 Tax=Basidiobolus ranarum TaxID=34480 RepID=A0ABR2VXH9_9FUNG